MTGEQYRTLPLQRPIKQAAKLLQNLPVGAYYITELPSVGYVVSDGQDYKQAIITAASRHATVTFYNKEVSSSNYGYLTLSKTIAGANGKLFPL